MEIQQEFVHEGLTKFIRREDVAARLKPLRPKVSRKIGAELEVRPRTSRGSLVGTAFDYLLRFEIERRAPHAKSGLWIAEYVPNLLSHKAAKRAKDILKKARDAVAAYLTNRSPTLSDTTILAEHAIRLAYIDCAGRPIDGVDRSGLLYQQLLEKVDPAEVEDLLEILAIVPFDLLLHDKVVLLNPIVELANGVGADADLIAGDMLVDFKCIRVDKMRVDYLDQLVVYLILCRHHRQANPAFPEIERVAMYFCRHAHLWTVDATTWTLLPEFAEFENWFVGRAKELLVEPEAAGRRVVAQFSAKSRSQAKTDRKP